ncbi:hypothetical protein GCM10022423_29570 [Flavobacterium ginsengiterrae]|uniref:Uncharacterized protein n=1 Tax=Flavobacterium ginsengiterrae TaxID=871695 RepID=A0ABP7GRC8_9FLAO
MIACQIIQYKIVKVDEAAFTAAILSHYGTYVYAETFRGIDVPRIVLRREYIDEICLEIFVAF